MKSLPPVAHQGYVSAGDGIGALAAHADAVEVLVTAGDGNVQALAVLDLAVDDGGQRGLFLDHGAALGIDGGAELIIPIGDGIQHLQHNIALVIAGGRSDAFTVDGHHQCFSFGGLQRSAGENGQSKQLRGFRNDPLTLYFLKCFHRNTSFCLYPN